MPESNSAFNALDLKPGSPEWLKERKKYITGSDAAKIAGVSRWGNSYDVWVDKCLEKKEEDRAEMNPIFKRGLALEAPIRAAYYLKTGDNISDDFFATSNIHPFMATTPDGLIQSSKRNVHAQIKTHVPWLADEYGESGSQDVPSAEYLQVMHESIVLGDEGGDLVVLFASEPVFDALIFMWNEGVGSCGADTIANYIIENTDLRIFPLKFPDKLKDDLIDCEKEFYENHIMARKEPGCSPVLKDSGNIRIATTDEMDMIETMKQAYILKKRSEDAWDALKARMIEIVGDDSGIDSGPAGGIGKVTYKRGKTGKVSYKDSFEQLCDKFKLSGNEKDRILDKNTGLPTRMFRYPHQVWKKEI